MQQHGLLAIEILRVNLASTNDGSAMHGKAVELLREYIQDRLLRKAKPCRSVLISSRSESRADGESTVYAIETAVGKIFAPKMTQA